MKIVLHRCVDLAFPEETSMNELLRLGREDRITRYVKLLLLGMVKRGEGVVVLDAASPLPPATHFGAQMPRFDLVADRIKQMAGVEPGPAAQPREGVIDVQVHQGIAAAALPYQVFVRFVDAPQRTVYLHLARTPAATSDTAEAPVGV